MNNANARLNELLKRTTTQPKDVFNKGNLWEVQFEEAPKEKVVKEKVKVLTDEDLGLKTHTTKTTKNEKVD